MKTNLILVLGTFIEGKQVEFLWKDKDVDGPQGSMKDWIWTKSKDFPQTTKRPLRRLGCFPSTLETGMCRPTIPPALPPSLQRALSSYFRTAAGAAEAADLIKELQQWSVPPNFSKQNALLNSALNLSVLFDSRAVTRSLLATNAVNLDSRNTLEAAINLALRSDPRAVNLASWTRQNRLMAKHGYSPLHVALIRGNNDILSMIVRSGADVTRTTSHGRTPLHVAAMMPEMQDSVGLLMRHGADITTRDHYGKTALDYAFKRGQGGNVRTMWEVTYAQLEKREKEGTHPVQAALRNSVLGGHGGAIPNLVWGYLRPARDGLATDNASESFVRSLFELLHWYVATFETAPQHDNKRKVSDERQ